LSVKSKKKKWDAEQMDAWFDNFAEQCAKSLDDEEAIVTTTDSREDKEQAND
jgi:hypothetical protein